LFVGGWSSSLPVLGCGGPWPGSRVERPQRSEDVGPLTSARCAACWFGGLTRVRSWASPGLGLRVGGWWGPVRRGACRRPALSGCADHGSGHMMRGGVPGGYARAGGGAAARSFRDVHPWCPEWTRARVATGASQELAAASAESWAGHARVASGRHTLSQAAVLGSDGVVCAVSGGTNAVSPSSRRVW
jgi:hypothetical protein